MTFAKVGAIGAVVLYFLGKHKKETTSGIGAAQRIKRRIYKEVSLAQDAGIDFSKKFNDLTSSEISALERAGQNAGWKQSKRSIESGKSYAEAYFNSLRRAWNAVSGVEGIGRAYDVKDADGNVCLTWIEDAANHVEQETPQETKPKSKKQTKAEIAQEKEEFAEKYLQEYILQHPNLKNYFLEPFNEHDGSRADIIIKEFVDGTAKLKKKIGRWTIEYEIYIGKKWHDDYSMNKDLWSFTFGLLYGWENRISYSQDELNTMRRDLLAKAKHMQVVIEDGDNVLANWDKQFVTGDERYDYLDKINYIVVVSQRYANGESVYYPVRSYPDELSANQFMKFKYSDHGKVVPIYDMPIERISGVSGVMGV